MHFSYDNGMFFTEQKPGEHQKIALQPPLYVPNDKSKQNILFFLGKKKVEIKDTKPAQDTVFEAIASMYSTRLFFASPVI